MDPQAAWQNLLDAHQARDGMGLCESAAALLEWLDRGGFPPQTIPGATMSDRWNRAVAMAGCLTALAEAKPWDI
jgi:hypothetical protein